MNRRKTSVTITSLLLACVLHADELAKAPSDRVIRRDGEPVCVNVAEEKKAMDRVVGGFPGSGR